jgi:Uma2 family endonuclease
MPTAVTDRPAKSDPPRKLWTRREFDRLSSSGLLDSQRLELIEGELIDKMGKKRAHVNSLTLLHAWLIESFGAHFVNPKAPIDVAPEDNPSNEPEPDLIVLKRDLSHFTNENPRPQDLQLVVEVADSTLRFDLTTKATLYARAGIVEYWVLDISGRRTIVHRDPQLGRYAYVAAYDGEESVAPLAAPESSFRVNDAFPG